jgi:3-oxoacyl-[acyl-carrier-protein] synthase-3
VVLPFLGRHSIEPMFFDGLGIDEHKTTFDFSRRIGHTGASDPFIGLDHLVSSKRLGSGDWILLLAVGVGFIWTAAVLQATPDEAA